MLEQNQEMIDNSVQDQTKVVSLFQFIRELNKLKQKAIVNYAEYPWARTVSSLPDDPDNISVFYRDRVENDDSADDGNILLSVRKPEFEKCPTSDSVFVEWLQPGWDLFKNEPSYFEIKSTVQNIDTPFDIDNEAEKFTDNFKRVNAYNEWIAKRQVWAERQKIIYQTRIFLRTCIGFILNCKEILKRKN